MNRWLIMTGLLICGSALAACNGPHASLDEEDISPIDQQKMAAFNAWLAEQKSEEPMNAFKPRPMSVSGVGRVKAAPDIAVITGTIKTKADQDDVAIDEAADIINAVQTAVKGQDVDFSFTQIRTSESRDPDCLARNVKANARYSAILRDNQYNANRQRQLEQGRDIKTKPRAPQNRLPRVVCPVTHIEATLSFAARVKPSAQAGNIINDLTAAGVNKVDLFGYDFSDYDALYKEASTKAVLDAKRKAELVAKTAGTQLTEIVSFAVDRPQRTARFGPQAMTITNHQNRNVAAGNYSQDQVVVTGARTYTPQSSYTGATTSSYSQIPQPAPVASYSSFSGYDGSSGSNNGQFTVFNGVSNQVVQSTNTIVNQTGEILTRVQVPTQTSQNTARNNALKMSLQAGQRTITVNARLNYLYKTPIDGTVPPPNG